MKIKFLMAGLLGLISAAAFAQKGELNNANTEFQKYQSLRGQTAKAIALQANTSLTNAKTSIDKAAANDKTAALPLTYALKGAIYASLAVQDTVPATSAPLFATADEATKKAKELDTKAENAKLIEDANINMAQYKLSLGVKDYQAAKYVDAYKEFDYYRTVLPEDTNAIYYTALAASNAGKDDPKYYTAAIENYKKLVTTKYSKGAGIYLNMSSIYLLSKDTVNSLKVATEGVAKFPQNAELRKREIEISLQTGKQADVISKIDAAIANDPQNKTLYYYEGLTYSQLGDAAEEAAAKAKDAAGKATAHRSALDSYGKAVDNYKKALAIDPDYFESNLNLGYVLERPAIDLYNEANKLPADKQKEYEVLLQKSNAQFDLAKPFLQKAVDLNPKSYDALSNLRNYYRGKSDPANAADNKAKANALKQQMDALTPAKN